MQSVFQNKDDIGLIKIKFKTKLKKPWTFDGEKYASKDLIYDIKINKSMKFRISALGFWRFPSAMWMRRPRIRR